MYTKYNRYEFGLNCQNHKLSACASAFVLLLLGHELYEVDKDENTPNMMLRDSTVPRCERERMEEGNLHFFGEDSFSMKAHTNTHP